MSANTLFGPNSSPPIGHVDGLKHLNMILYSSQLVTLKKRFLQNAGGSSSLFQFCDSSLKGQMMVCYESRRVNGSSGTQVGLELHLSPQMCLIAETESGLLWILPRGLIKE